MISPCLFIDIDTQESFFKKPVNSKQGLQPSVVKKNLKKLTAHAKNKCIKIISPIDTAVTVKDGEFKKNLKKLKESVMDGAPYVVKLGDKIADIESIFQKNHQIIVEKKNFDTFTNPYFVSMLEKSGIQNLVIYGYGIDFGIEKTVTNLIKKNFKVWIPVDAVLAINEDNREPSVKELHTLGVQIWNTDFIIDNT